MKLKEMDIDERPRERLLKYGASSLSNTELLAILLNGGTKNYNALSMSSTIIKNINGFYNLKNVTKEMLLKEKGIGLVKAVNILAMLEIAKRLYLDKSYKRTIRYNNASVIYNDNKYLFYDKMQEYFYCIYVNSKNEVIERKLLFMGTVNRALVHPREIFKNAYLTSASGIICMHNHPSGDVTPSMEDIMLTKSLEEIGRLQNIPIIDHIIIGCNTYYSFYEDNKLGVNIWNIKSLKQVIFI